MAEDNHTTRVLVPVPLSFEMCFKIEPKQINRSVSPLSLNEDVVRWHGLDFSVPVLLAFCLRV